MKGTKKAKTAPAARSARPRRKAAAAAVPLRIKSILVPLDFSTPSRQTLAYAVEVARQFQAKLTLLHVVEPVAMPDFAAAFPLVLEPGEMVAAARTELAQAVQAAGVPPALVEKLLVRVGRSFHEIATAARSRKADLIIISTHGYTGVKHALLGSTTERVVRHAPCPVLVVRQRR
jgi:nucleotide-binding universal stress UspA family protein